MADLRDTVHIFNTCYQGERQQAQAALNHVRQEYELLRGMLDERKRLERLLRVQGELSGIESKIRGDYMEREEASRVLKGIKEHASEVKDASLEHHLISVER